MNSFSLLMEGFATALTPINLLYAVIGVILGTAVGVLPGIGPAMTVALLLPLTYDLEPTSAFIMFAGIYYGGMYGGSTTSILLNTPGESSSVVTAIEGNKMAKAGKAAQALATAAIGSFVAGTIGTLLLVMTAPLIVKVAVGIGAQDYFAIMVLAFVAVTAVLGASRVRGFASLAIGLTIGLVGIDSTTGQQRLTFGLPLLADGIDVVVVAVGIFAVGEALWVAAHLRRTPAEIIPVGRAWMGKEDFGRSWKPWLRGTAFGFPFGALPAGGAEIPTFLSYVTEKKLSKRPEEFGHGAIEGVAGPEASNNASAAGTLVPMLALGLPVSATAAVMLAAFQSYGIQPGPLLFDREPELVWGLIASLFIGNALLLILNLPLAPFWAKLLSIPRPYLYAGILFFASLGAFAVNAQAFDLVLLLVLGALGFAMRRFGLPVLPAIIGVILGPRAELQLRRALQISGGEWSGLFSSPLAIGIYCLVALILIWPLINLVVRRVRPRPAHGVHHGHAHPLVELAEELAAGTDDLDKDESVLARAERASSRRDEPSSPDKAPDKAPEKAPETPPEDRSHG
jgi:putative tricarboxylic transport membrane protein